MSFFTQENLSSSIRWFFMWYMIFICLLSTPLASFSLQRLCTGLTLQSLPFSKHSKHIRHPVKPWKSAPGALKVVMVTGQQRADSQPYPMPWQPILLSSTFPWIILDVQGPRASDKGRILSPLALHAGNWWLLILNLLAPLSLIQNYFLTAYSKDAEYSGASQTLSRFFLKHSNQKGQHGGLFQHERHEDGPLLPDLGVGHDTSDRL